MSVKKAQREEHGLDLQDDVTLGSLINVPPAYFFFKKFSNPYALILNKY